MGDVGIRHDEAVAADASNAAARRRATMDGHAFADHVVVADLQPSFLAFKLQVLRLEAERRKGKDTIVGADVRRTLEHNMRQEFAALAHLNLFADNAEGADGATRGNPRCRMDDSGGMYMR